MEPPIPSITPLLLQDALLLKREKAILKVASIFEGETKELCIRTRYPKEMTLFISACLSQRGELETGAGERCVFIRDRESWTKTCSTSINKILIAHGELDFEGSRAELLQQARSSNNSVIYALTNPRPDNPNIVDLLEPNWSDVSQLLSTHKFPPAEAERLAKYSNGNIYLLLQQFSGTSERRTWAKPEKGYSLRGLSLLGGWDDSSAQDQSAISELIEEPYGVWVKQVYPLTKEEEPPVLLEGRIFRPVSRYETLQQLGPFLTDSDLERFAKVAIKVLGEIDPLLEIPKKERALSVFSDAKSTYSTTIKKGISETLAILGGQGKKLQCSATLPAMMADKVIHSLFNKATWQRWASLSEMIPMLAEASPSEFLTALETAIGDPKTSTLRELFDSNDDIFYGKSYHVGILWALETLAWHPDFLIRACLCLTRLAEFKLSPNSGNNPLESMRNILLCWFPQTLANIERRRIAVEKVLEENIDIGWNLLFSIIPANHQLGNFNPKPVWRDWIDGTWKEGATRSEIYKQTLNYAQLAVQHAVDDPSKLSEMIKNIDRLPKEIFSKIVEYLHTPQMASRPEKERFVIWEKLTEEIQRHRRYSGTDWAMPEDELIRLEESANHIKPSSPSILFQRLFNYRGYELYDSANYLEEEEKIASERDKAISKIIKQTGVNSLIDIAKNVKFPSEIGQAAGRISNQNVDSFFLPKFLKAKEKFALDLVHGFIWSRYFRSTHSWLDTLDFNSWSKSERITFFCALPFHAEVWRKASAILGNSVSEFWDRIQPNTLQADKSLLEAIELSLTFNRPDIATQCIHSLSILKQPMPIDLAIASLRARAAYNNPISSHESHDLLDIIQNLQQVADIDPEEMADIEYLYLKLLDPLTGGTPLFLERKMAKDPEFFHNAIKTCYRSEFERDQPRELSESDKLLASHTYGLLRNWNTLPGIIDKDKIDHPVLNSWILEVKKLCTKSGHWAIAQQLIGHTMAFPPAGLDGLLLNPEAAKILDQDEFGDMRTGFHLALFNNRGVHSYTEGNAELALAKYYHEFASKYEDAKFIRIANALRSLAQTYERDAEREANQNPFRAD